MSIENYAKALFDLAKEQNKIDIITFHFDDFMNAMEKNPYWVTMMDSPMISFDEKKSMIDHLEYDVSFLAFLKMLAQKNLMYAYHEIYPVWAHMSRIFLNIAHIHLYSAIPVTEAQENALRKVIQPRFLNKKITFHTTIDPNLIGGVKIVYQGQSLDRSVARELEELYTTI
jgi:F-type H+-transporting ATPase subunit delta